MLTGILDNTSQVHCNQWMCRKSRRFIAALIVYGGIPFNLCLGISSADVADNALADCATRRDAHRPIFGVHRVREHRDQGKRDFPAGDLGVLEPCCGAQVREKGEAADGSRSSISTRPSC